MAQFSLTDAIALVRRALHDTGATALKQLVIDGDVAAFCAQAVARYSLDRPRTVVADVTADGTDALALPEGWADGVSRVISIEHPLGAMPPAERDERGWFLYETPTGTVVRFSESAPASGAHVRVRYTAPHVLDDVGSTIPDAHFHAVCDLTVSICADAIAQKYAQTSDPAIGADLVNYRTKSQEWGDRAKRYEARYKAIVAPSGATTSSDTVNWDSRASYGSDWLTHPRTFR